MIGYKAFNNDLTCRDFQYEIGKTYTMDKRPILCKRGFHFCDDFLKVFRFYNYLNNIRICKVEAKPFIYYESDLSKYVTNNITILEEIKDIEKVLIDKMDFRHKNLSFKDNNSQGNIEIIKSVLKNFKLVGENKDNFYFCFLSPVRGINIYSIQDYLDDITLDSHPIKTIVSEWFIPSEYEVFKGWYNGNESFDKSDNEIFLYYLEEIKRLDTICWLRSSLDPCLGGTFCVVDPSGNSSYHGANASLDILPVFTVPKPESMKNKTYLKF